ncbi:MAG: glycoside hydrolase family 27 protein [Bacteroidales bacterium]
MKVKLFFTALLTVLTVFSAYSLSFVCSKTFYALPNVNLMNKFMTDEKAKISVENLPDGLVFNLKRNIVTGKIKKEGIYKYVITAKNKTDIVRDTVTLTISDDIISPTPLMGWFSWNVFESDIDEQKIREITDAFVESGLRDLGYTYINIDDNWHAKKRDSNGKLDCNRTKFPSGIKVLADYVHSKGMKLGIYSDAAPQTCAGEIGSLGYEEIDARQYASWGCDLLKYDYCGAPANRDTAIIRYAKMGKALKDTGNKFFYYACEWGERQPWLWAADCGANCWRATFDTRDGWDLTPYDAVHCGVIQGVDIMKGIPYYAGVNRFNDADMMMAGLYGKGKSSTTKEAKGMTDTEYRSQFSMWCMFASPLTLSFDVRQMDDATKKIIMNKEMIAINQDRLGQQAILLENNDGKEIYYKDLENGDMAVALFNRNDKPEVMEVKLKSIYLSSKKNYLVRDLWNNIYIDMPKGVIKSTVAPHETKVYRISRKP